jgi:hypothetical protein
MHFYYDEWYYIIYYRLHYHDQFAYIYVLKKFKYNASIHMRVVVVSTRLCANINIYLFYILCE